MSLIEEIRKALQGASAVGVLGVGSELRADDNVGMAVASALEVPAGTKPPVKVFLGGVAPENLTGEIRKFKPSHLLIIDCGDFGGRPGEARMVHPDEDQFGGTFSTHKLPVKMLIDFLKGSFPFKTALIVVQPGTIEFGAPMSAEIGAAARSISSDLTAVLKEL